MARIQAEPSRRFHQSRDVRGSRNVPRSAVPAPRSRSASPAQPRDVGACPAQSRDGGDRAREGTPEFNSGAPDAPFDPDHHLWRNGRLWWVAFTVHLPGWRKERIRLSLGTTDVVEARRRRDRVLREYPLVHGCELSLRLAPRRATRPAQCGSGARPDVAA